MSFDLEEKRPRNPKLPVTASPKKVENRPLDYVLPRPIFSLCIDCVLPSAAIFDKRNLSNSVAADYQSSLICFTCSLHFLDYVVSLDLGV
jgi:hypothetical protein